MEEIENFKSSHHSLDKKLISLVKERPILYDLRILDRPKEVKQVLWQQVSEALKGELSPNAAAHRWKYLRQCFMKNRIKLKLREDKVKQIGLTLPARRVRKLAFEYHSIMEFLEETISHEPGAGRIRYPKDYKKVSKMPNIIKRVVPIAPKPSVTSVNNTDLSSNIVTNNIDNVGPFTFVHIPSVPSPQPSIENDNSSNTNSDPKTSVTDYDKIFLECLQRPIEQPSPVDGFLIRLGEGLKKLPYRERSKLELEFLQRLYEVEEQLENCDQSTSEVQV